MLAQLQARPELVVAVLQYDHCLRGAVAQFKAVARLADGTSLHLNEVWIDDELRKYAYYQVMPTGEVLRGWDNAPHHPEVRTYPHHLHCADDVRLSEARTLPEVLDMLAQEIAGRV